jgi:membrane-associated protein
MIEFIRHLLAPLYDTHQLAKLVERGGPFLVSVIVFIETGMFVGFVLPGDSLLVAAGVVAGSGHMKLLELLLSVTACAIAGDQVGYFVGRKAGQQLYRRQDSRFFKKRHLEQAHTFYEANGGKAVIIARFVPIIRTFCPPVAGAAKMDYRRYLAYDVVGGFLWVWGMVLFGYAVASNIPNADKYLHFIIAGVIAVSLLPVAYHAWKARRGGAADPTKKTSTD